MKLQNQTSKLDFSLMIACILGGTLGCFLAEKVYGSFTVTWHPVLRVGIYLGIFVLCFSLFGLISEMITNNLRELRWTGSEKGKALLLALILSVIYIVLAMLFQFIYGLGYKATQSPDIDDYIILIDHSGSTAETDPQNERFSSVEAFVQELDNQHQIMIKVFNDTIVGSFPMEYVTAQTEDKISEFFQTVSQTERGGTDIQLALLDALENSADSERSTALLLLSDGESFVDRDLISHAYLDRKIPIYSVAFANIGFSGRRILNNLADDTGGYYYEITELSDLNGTVKNMISMTRNRNILEPRRGQDKNSILHTIERIGFLCLLGITTLIIMGVLMDIRDVVAKGMWTHLPAVLAGAVLVEIAMRNGIVEQARFAMCWLFSLIAVPYVQRVYDNEVEDAFYDIGEIGLKPTSAGSIKSTKRKRSLNGSVNEFKRGGKR